MKVLIISPDYPDFKRSVYTFVKQLVDQFARMGHTCCIIAPYSVTRNKRLTREIGRYDAGNGNIVTILRPNHLSLSSFSLWGVKPSDIFRNRAIKRALRHIPFTPDVVYAHFWRSGREIYTYAKTNCIPLFVATGESEIPKEDVNPSFQSFYDYVRGVVCVSSKNMEESIRNEMTTKAKCLVAPNAVNPKLFHVLDKTGCRRKLGISEDLFIVAFCGTFVHRKGVRVLSEAINSIEGQAVYSLFMGRSQSEQPSCRNILFQGPVPHEKLPTYLNAADIFVLPTLHEGCCNAIIEALACGLPVISSDRPFNKDILNETNSILVNPEDAAEVARAIVELRDNNHKRKVLSEGAIKTAENLTIEKRAVLIDGFIREKLDSKFHRL